MQILYEDAALAVCLKPAGVLSEDAAGGMPSLLREHWGDGAYVGVVHRLDREVGGLMVYARTREAAAYLSEVVAQRRVEKRYLAAIHGVTDPEGELTDWLFKDAKTGKTYVVDRERKGVREAKLRYKTLLTADDLSLVEVALLTGRSHQIRVQFGSRRHPLFGDRRYGAADKAPGVALWSCALGFPHPGSGEMMHFTAAPQEAVWQLPAIQGLKEGWNSYGNL